MITSPLAGAVRIKLRKSGFCRHRPQEEGRELSGRAKAMVDKRDVSYRLNAMTCSSVYWSSEGVSSSSSAPGLVPAVAPFKSVFMLSKKISSSRTKNKPPRPFCDSVQSCDLSNAPSWFMSPKIEYVVLRVVDRAIFAWF